MKFLHKVLWSVPLLALSVAGCGGRGAPDAGNSAANAVSKVPLDQSAPAGANSGRKLRIAMIPKSLHNPVFAYAYRGAQNAAQKLGNVEIQRVGPPTENPAMQAALVESQAAQGVAGILISVADPVIVQPAIDKAIAKGIPVVTFDSDAPTSQRTAFYGVDDLRLGQRLGNEIGTLLKGQGRVVIMSGTRGAYNMQKREEGVRVALQQKFPRIKILQTYHCNDNVAQSVKIVADVQRSQKPAGWVMLGSWPMMSANGLSAIKPAQTKVVAVDAVPETWPWIEKNVVQFCVGQKVFGWGRVGVELLVNAINKKPVQPVNDSGFDVVTPQNLARYKKQWATMSKE
jgi:ribose transport system substrate-binding protein